MTPVEEVLDGADLNQDLHQLIGYTWSVGANDPTGAFPSDHLSDLVEFVLKKYEHHATHQG